MAAKKTFIAVALLLSTGSLSAATTWVRLNPQFTYRDLNTNCSNRELIMPTYLGVEVGPNGPAVAVFRRSLKMPWTASHQLSPADVSRIEITQDEKGRSWIRKLHLSVSALNWVFFNSSAELFQCVPPQALSTIAPGSHEFVFATDEVTPSPGKHLAAIHPFSGMRKDDGVYRASLGWEQVQLTKSDYE